MKLKESEVIYPNFVDDNKIYVVRCQKCRQENYAPAVASGQCAICGEKHILEVEKK